MTEGQRNAGAVKSKNNKDRSFAPVTAESMRQRMTIRTNRDLQHVLARMGKAAKNNCGRIRCSPDELGPKTRAFLVDKLGYLVTYIEAKDKYEIRWAGTPDEDEPEDVAVEIDPDFAEG